MKVGEHSICYRYEAQLEKDWHYILGDSDSKLLIVATEAIYEKVKDYVGKVSAEFALPATLQGARLCLSRLLLDWQSPVDHLPGRSG
jgi:long-subunit acyl-CoA synthetase (AMP-forming)